MFMFATNIQAVLLRETGLAILAALVIGAIAIGLSSLVARRRDKIVCLACGLVAWCIWYGRFAYWLAVGVGIGPLAGGSTTVALGIWTVAWLIYGLAMFRGFAVRVLAPTWLVASVALVVMPALTVAAFPLSAAARPRE